MPVSAKAAAAGECDGGVSNGRREARASCGPSPLVLICETEPYQKDRHGAWSSDPASTLA